MSTDPADLLTFLPSIALFGGLEQPTLERIISMLTVQHLEPGTEVCRQGEVGRSMFVVRSGEAVIYRDNEDGGGRMRFKRLGPGEFFGEMTLLDIMKRSATVVVEKPTVLLSLGNKELYRLYNEDVAGYVMVLQNLCRELSRRLRTTNQKLHSMAEEAGDENTLIREALKPRR
jgi:CRP/FNR family cyclic AMP-dependent transcriptional regulator